VRTQVEKGSHHEGKNYSKKLRFSGIHACSFGQLNGLRNSTAKVENKKRIKNQKKELFFFLKKA
jgi:hypothetical protein